MRNVRKNYLGYPSLKYVILNLNVNTSDLNGLFCFNATLNLNWI